MPGAADRERADEDGAKTAIVETVQGNENAVEVMQTPEHTVQEAAPTLFTRLEASLGHLIRRTQQLHTVHWNEHVVTGITGGQYAILTVIAAYPGIRRTMVEEIAALDRSTSAEIISRLQAGSWIERARAPHDARRSELALTPPTRVALPVITAQVREVQDRLLSGLAETERSDLVRLLAMVAYAEAPELRLTAPSEPDAPVLDLTTTPTHLLRRAEQRHQRLWTSIVQGLATPTQYAVLCALAGDALDQKTVSALASLDTSTAADVISRLRRQGIVLVAPDERDRRRNLVRLAPAALDLLAELTPKAEAVHRELCSPLSPAETARLKALLRRISFGVDSELSHSG